MTDMPTQIPQANKDMRMTDAREAMARIDTHEAVCAERYAGINAQLRRLEKWFVTLITMLIGLGVTIIRGGGL